MNFSKNIKKIRSVKGLNQEAFGQLFDLSRATVGAYEEGRALPKIETLIQIANYISVSIDDLLLGNLTVNQIHGFAKVEKWSQQKGTVTNPLIPYYQNKKELTRRQSSHNIQIPDFLSIDSFAVEASVLGLDKDAIYFFESQPYSKIESKASYIVVADKSVFYGNDLKEEKNQIIYPNGNTVLKKEIVNFGKEIGVLLKGQSSYKKSEKTLLQRVENLETQLDQLLKKENE